MHKRKQKRKLFKFLFLVILLLSIITIPIINSIIVRNDTIAKLTLISNNTNHNKNYIICIDPGHGDWDVGATSINGNFEKNIVLDISLKLGDLLEKNNIKVIYTRATDSIPWIDSANDSLRERIRISSISNADLFLSIHCNSNSKDSTIKGVETWYNPINPESKYFSSLLQCELNTLNYTSNRGLKTYIENEELAVLELNSAVASLVELGFISNIEDEKFLLSEEGQDKCAQALFTAIITYLDEL